MGTDKEWQITNQRFVAFFDIMGFKDMVARSTHLDIYNMMEKISKLITTVNKAHNPDEFKDKSAFTLNFSDSIFLFSCDDTPESFNLFSLSSSYLFGGCIAKSIPLKGSLAYGTISVNKDSQIYFGQPIIDAFLLQDEINYYGIVAHHTFEKYHSSINNSYSKDLFFKTKTPLKSGVVEHLNLDWSPGYEFVTKDEKEPLTLIQKVDSFKMQMSGGIRKYIDCTKEIFLKKLQPPTSL